MLAWVLFRIPTPTTYEPIRLRLYSWFGKARIISTQANRTYTLETVRNFR